MKHIPFFIRQGWCNLACNGQRTLFVLFSIAVGVAAIVSLRTLGLMIDASLTRNLQADNRGDIVVTVPVSTIASGGDYDASLVEVDDDIFAVDSFSAEGIKRMRAWAEDKGYEITVASRNGSPIRVRTVGRIGTSEAAFPFFIEPERYPLYGETELVEPRDITLAQALSQPHNIVITEQLAEALDVHVGDLLRLVGPNTYEVSGIVDQSAEATLLDINSMFAPYVFLRYDSGVEAFDVEGDTVYLRLPPGSDAGAGAAEFLATFQGMGVFTTDDLREENSTLGASLTKLVTIMGLASLLIGGIGIINTMRVVVNRRTLEIGVLKTVGLQGRHITLMFFIEACLLGVLGSIPGVLLGLALVTILQRLAESVYEQSLQFAIYPRAIVMGLVTGVLVTLVFGFLPTLSAGRVRPNVVLSPGDAVVPRAGRRLSVLTVVVLTATMGLLVGQILGRIGLGIGLAYAAMLVLGMAALILRGVVFVGSRLPTFGSTYVKLSQRAIRGQSGRTASTLLALAVGMFALSLVLLFTTSLINVINEFMTNQFGGNVIAGGKTREADQQVRSLLDESVGIKSVTHETVYPARIAAINGDRDIDAILENARQNARNEAGQSRGEELVTSREGVYDPYLLQLRGFVERFDMRRASETHREYELTAGNAIRPTSDKSIWLHVSDEARWLGLNVGDRLALQFDGQDERTVTVAGLMTRPSSEVVVVNLGDETPAISSDNVVPDGLAPRPSAYVVDVEEASVDAVLTALSELPDVVALEASQLNELLERIFKQLSALPLMVAVLALFASGVIIANTVSLATLERRRQIGIMKAIGLRSRDVLRLLLLENGLVGLIGGVIGAGMGGLGVVLLGVVSDDPGGFPVLTLVALVVLAVAIAMGATLVTAYSAARERPLIVLRYE
jgi:putative ABC transport system permease protein